MCLVIFAFMIAKKSLLKLLEVGNKKAGTHKVSKEIYWEEG